MLHKDNIHNITTENNKNSFSVPWNLSLSLSARPFLHFGHWILWIIHTQFIQTWCFCTKGDLISQSTQFVLNSRSLLQLMLHSACCQLCLLEVASSNFNLSCFNQQMTYSCYHNCFLISSFSHWRSVFTRCDFGLKCWTL